MKYYKQTFFAVLVGILLCSAYTVPYYFDFILDNSHRIHMSFQDALVCQDTIVKSIRSIFNPLYSDAHGNFNSSSIILIPMFLPFLFFWTRIPRAILSIWLLFFITFLLSTGSSTNLYYLFWKYFPFADCFRIPQRVNTILPLVLLLILIWLIKATPLQITVLKKTLQMPLYIPLAITSLIICILYNNPIIISGYYDTYHPASFNQIPNKIIIFSHLAGILTLSFLTLYGLLKRKSFIELLIILLAALQVFIYMNYGTWRHPKEKNWLSIEQIEKKKKESLAIINTPRYWKWHFATKLVSFHVETQKAPLEKRLARITKNYIGVPSQEEVYKNLKLARAKDHVLIEGLDPKYSKLTPTPTKTDQVFLDYSSYNKVIFKAINQSPGFFVFSFPYSKHWEAYINSKRSKILKANGIEQAVWIPKGNHTIEFRYWSPAAFWGMFISHLTLFGVIIFVTFAIKRIKIRAILYTLTFLSLCFTFYTWYNSLYHGINLETKYSWSTPNNK